MVPAEAAIRVRIRVERGRMRRRRRRRGVGGGGPADDARKKASSASSCAVVAGGRQIMTCGSFLAEYGLGGFGADVSA